MSGFTTTSPDHLIRSQLWSAELKEILEDELMGARYVRDISDFTDGEVMNIPSIGQAEVDNYVENEDVKFRAMDTGNFQFSITEYVSSATYVTDKMKQDSIYMAMITSTFVPKQARAIMQKYEQDVFALGNSQTISDNNVINTAEHRFVATGASNAMAIADFPKALYALKKANVPQNALTAIVDPSVEYTINTLTQLTSVADNPMFEGIVTSGIGMGPRFIRNIYGFDTYVSNYLADAPAAEVLDTVNVGADGYKVNLFFSAQSDILPFIGSWRQSPRVESERNMKKQRDEYVTTARYGVALYRPENLVCVLSNPAVVA
jgi:hypothetical protein